MEKVTRNEKGQFVKGTFHFGMIGKNNPNWKGDSVGYNALHDWVRNRLSPKPYLCTRCKKRPTIDLANISQEYKRDLDDWEWVCRRCHMILDGRMENLAKITKKRRVRKVVPKVYYR